MQRLTFKAWLHYLVTNKQDLASNYYPGKALDPSWQHLMQDGPSL